jgi:hypothetical protein
MTHWSHSGIAFTEGHDDAAIADLIVGFINLGMVLVKEIEILSDESTEEVLRKTSEVIAGMGYDGAL